MQQTTAVLGIDDDALQEEVLHFLERLPDTRVVGTARGGSDLARKVGQARPDVAVVSARFLAEAPDLDGAAVLVVSERETTEALRAAIAVGARGFYLWPEERGALARDAVRARRVTRAGRSDPGRVLAVYGPRGGAGTTFLATNLAAACARQGAATLLIDLDIHFADVTGALGLAGANPEPRTMADLAPVLDELDAEHLDRVVHDHAAGFEVLLAPGNPTAVGPPTADQVRELARVAASRYEMVILHCQRGLESSTLGAAESADSVLLVATLDVLALRDARRALDLLSSRGASKNCRLVINRATRGELIPADAERVLGLSPAVVIRFDRAVPRAQNRGELVVGRSSRASRAVQSLARKLLEEERP